MNYNEEELSGVSINLSKLFYEGIKSSLTDDFVKPQIPENHFVLSPVVLKKGIGESIEKIDPFELQFDDYSDEDTLKKIDERNKQVCEQRMNGMLTLVDFLKKEQFNEDILSIIVQFV